MQLRLLVAFLRRLISLAPGDMNASGLNILIDSGPRWILFTLLKKSCLVLESARLQSKSFLVHIPPCTVPEADLKLSQHG